MDVLRWAERTLQVPGCLYTAISLQPAVEIQRQDLKQRSHSCVARFVDDDRLPRLIHVVVHAKVGCYTMQQHAMIGSHLRELLVLVTGGETKQKMRVTTMLQIKHKNILKKM